MFSGGSLLNKSELKHLDPAIHLQLIYLHGEEAIVRRYSVKKVFLKILQNLQENTCAKVTFSIKLQAESYSFIKKETLPQVFFCGNCEIFKGTAMQIM